MISVSFNIAFLVESIHLYPEVRAKSLSITSHIFFTETGTVYKRVLVDNEDEYYQDYHMTPLEDLPAARTSDCQCTCESCTRCHTRVKQLPPTHYVMAVKSDIFRRMFDEVSASKNMPCGLFFCGHHEDVRHPSVGIAIVIVSILFAALLLATIYVSG